MITYFVILLIGLIGGAFCVFVLIEHRRWEANELQKKANSDAIHNETVARGLQFQKSELETQAGKFQTERKVFEANVISYTELQSQNAILKRDLRNLDVSIRKQRLDLELHRKTQIQIDEHSQALAKQYIKDSLRSIMDKLNPTNYALSKQRLQEVIARCRNIGFEITAAEEAGWFENLQKQFELTVRAALEREEQARIKARIREEMKIERERAQELERVESERRAIQEALNRALSASQELHSAEIQELEARLAEAESRQRAISMAQMTKAGTVYVISNIGSFGRDVYKVGMTRRLTPKDRVDELGDASVPFPFDIHMMISCTDAPRLENALHRELHLHRVNRCNPRKEFFRIDLDTIVGIVEKNHGVVEYTADPEALQYHESLNMTDEDQERIESIYESVGVKDEDQMADDPAGES